MRETWKDLMIPSTCGFGSDRFVPLPFLAAFALETDEMEQVDGGKKLTDVINETHENARYLPQMKLPENLIAVPSLREVVKVRILSSSSQSHNNSR
jgi:glycerol-3-phosphate dehydrogenase